MVIVNPSANTHYFACWGWGEDTHRMIAGIPPPTKPCHIMTYLSKINHAYGIHQCNRFQWQGHTSMEVFAAVIHPYVGRSKPLAIPKLIDSKIDSKRKTPRAGVICLKLPSSQVEFLQFTLIHLYQKGQATEASVESSKLQKSCCGRRGGKQVVVSEGQWLARCILGRATKVTLYLYLYINHAISWR